MVLDGLFALVFTPAKYPIPPQIKSPSPRAKHVPYGCVFTMTNDLWVPSCRWSPRVKPNKLSRGGQVYPLGTHQSRSSLFRSCLSEIALHPLTHPRYMLLSKSCEYGMRATLYLASLNEEGYVSIGTISDELNISFPYLTKIFQQLNKADLLMSHRGPNGGVALTRAPEDITLHEIIVAIDGEELFTDCVLGLPGCGDAEPCPLHESWASERGRLEKLFQNTSLKDMSSRIHDFNVRLKASM